MKIIDKVKIGGFVYDVKRTEGAFVDNSGLAVDGIHIFANHNITVGKAGSKEYQNLVFLHEICHAIISCYLTEEEQDEKFVEQFSKGLYQVLIDNPEMLEVSENDR